VDDNTPGPAIPIFTSFTPLGDEYVEEFPPFLPSVAPGVIALPDPDNIPILGPPNVGDGPEPFPTPTPPPLGDLKLNDDGRSCSRSRSPNKGKGPNFIDPVPVDPLVKTGTGVLTPCKCGLFFSTPRSSRSCPPCIGLADNVVVFLDDARGGDITINLSLSLSRSL